MSESSAVVLDRHQEVVVDRHQEVVVDMLDCIRRDPQTLIAIARQANVIIDRRPQPVSA